MTGKAETGSSLLNKTGPVLRPLKGLIQSDSYAGYGSVGVNLILPVGFEDQSGNHQHMVWLEPLTGKEEQWTARVGRDLNLSEWVSKLIDSKAIWKDTYPDRNRATRLSVADRDMLVLYLRMITFGAEVWGTTSCPHKGCESNMDFSFDLTTLEIPAVKQSNDLLSASVNYRSKKINFTYREPNGADQEVVCALEYTQPYNALLELLARCLTRVDGLPEILPDTLGSLPYEVLFDMDKEIASGMTSLDWDIELTCPECNKGFISTLDLQAFFWEEIHSQEEDFWDDVHQLAFYYHWPEADILSLTRWKRKMFLSHIRRQLAK